MKNDKKNSKEIMQLRDGSFFFVRDVVRVLVFPKSVMLDTETKDRCCIVLSRFPNTSGKPESYMHEYFDTQEEAKAFSDKLKGTIEELWSKSCRTNAYGKPINFIKK